MILLGALLAGLLAGWAWARWQKRPYRAPVLRSAWLVLLGFLPQLLLAYIPGTQRILPDRLAAIAHSASLVLFLAFVWVNRRLPGMPVLLAGLLLNLLVIWANGGWMPISPETATKIVGDDAVKYFSAGDRFGQKDVLLAPQETHLVLLSDRFLLPAWSPYQVAFSMGDILIAAGAFWLMARRDNET